MDRVELGPVSSSNLTYDQAWLYCITLSHNGHKDWQMPSMGLWLSSHKIQGWASGHEHGNLFSTTQHRSVTPVRKK